MAILYPAGYKKQHLAWPDIRFLPKDNYLKKCVQAKFNYSFLSLWKNSEITNIFTIGITKDVYNTITFMNIT